MYIFFCHKWLLASMHNILRKHTRHVTSLRAEFLVCTSGPSRERHGQTVFHAIETLHIPRCAFPSHHCGVAARGEPATHWEEAERRGPHEDQIIAGSAADTLSCQRGTAHFRWEGLQRGGGGGDGGGYFHAPSLTGDGGRSLWCNSRVHRATLIPFAGIATWGGGQRPFR